MPYTVLLPEDMSAVGKDYLSERDYALCFCECNDLAILEAVRNCEAIITRNSRITGEIMRAAPKLRVVARHGVGVDTIDLETAKELGIWVTNGPESNINAVAEQVIGAIISLARQLTECDRMVRLGQYGRRTSIAGTELSGKVLGVVGFGKIGKLVAQKASLGLGMRIIVYDPFASQEFHNFPVAFHCALDDVLAAADVVTLHMPLLPTTERRISAEQFGQMKNSALFINYARAGLVNTDALVKALQDGVIAGAAIDVFDTEPVPQFHQLCSLTQVLLSPHTASFTRESLDNMALHAAITIDEVLTSKIPRWFVVQGR